MAEKNDENKVSFDASTFHEEDIACDDDEETASDNSSFDEVDEESAANPLKGCMENDLSAQASNRISHAIGIAMPFMPNFSLDTLKHEPFASCKGKKCEPTRDLLVKELSCRGSKGHAKLSLDKLIDKLGECPLAKNEKEHIQNMITNYANAMTKTRAEKADNAKENNCMAGEGRIRLHCCALHGTVLPLCRAAQNCLSRSELDARNSSERILTFQEGAPVLFNDESCILESRVVPEAHEKFSSPLDLSKPEGVEMTLEKVKNNFQMIKLKVFSVMLNYENSENRAGQRREDDPEWGKFDLDQCIDGDDRASFLPNRSKDWHMLHWWILLEEVQLLNYALARLPEFMKENSEMRSLALRSRDAHKKGDKQTK